MANIQLNVLPTTRKINEVICSPRLTLKGNGEEDRSLYYVSDAKAVYMKDLANELENILKTCPTKELLDEAKRIIKYIVQTIQENINHGGSYEAKKSWFSCSRSSPDMDIPEDGDNGELKKNLQKRIEEVLLSDSKNKAKLELICAHTNTLITNRKYSLCGGTNYTGTASALLAWVNGKEFKVSDRIGNERANFLTPGYIQFHEGIEFHEKIEERMEFLMQGDNPEDNGASSIKDEIQGDLVRLGSTTVSMVDSRGRTITKKVLDCLDVSILDGKRVLQNGKVTVNPQAQIPSEFRPYIPLLVRQNVINIIGGALGNVLFNKYNLSPKGFKDAKVNFKMFCDTDGVVKVEGRVDQPDVRLKFQLMFDHDKVLELSNNKYEGRNNPITSIHIMELYVNDTVAKRIFRYSEHKPCYTPSRYVANYTKQMPSNTFVESNMKEANRVYASMISTNRDDIKVTDRLRNFMHLAILAKSDKIPSFNISFAENNKQVIFKIDNCILFKYSITQREYNELMGILSNVSISRVNDDNEYSLSKNISLYSTCPEGTFHINNKVAVDLIYLEHFILKNPHTAAFTDIFDYFATIASLANQDKQDLFKILIGFDFQKDEVDTIYFSCGEKQFFKYEISNLQVLKRIKHLLSNYCEVTDDFAHTHKFKQPYLVLQKYLFEEKTRKLLVKIADISGVDKVRVNLNDNEFIKRLRIDLTRIDDLNEDDKKKFMNIYDNDLDRVNSDFLKNLDDDTLLTIISMDQRLYFHQVFSARDYHVMDKYGKVKTVVMSVLPSGEGTQYVTRFVRSSQGGCGRLKWITHISGDTIVVKTRYLTTDIYDNNTDESFNTRLVFEDQFKLSRQKGKDEITLVLVDSKLNIDYKSEME